MSNERTDEFLKWRSLLDQPDARPDQVLDDREATWQKLADRLGEHRRNRLYGYRIAAACLLFALIIPAVRLFQDRHSTAVNLRAVPAARPVAAAAVRQQHAPAGAVTTMTQLLPSPLTRPREGRPTARTAKAPARKTAGNHLPLLANIASYPSPIIAAPLDPAGPGRLSQPSGREQGLSPGTRPGARTKELRVVHQNEIRGGNTSSPAVSAANGDRLINFFFPPSWQQPSVVPPASTDDPAVLKIKLSPSN
jgi:hypothetical protein